MEALFNALKKAKSIAAWKVNVEARKSCELFYVQTKVETNRATDTIDTDVTIYVDLDGKRGQSSFAVYSYMDEAEISKLIEENVFAAKFTLNRFFELPSPSDAPIHQVESNLSKRPFKEIIGEIGGAIMAANHLENGSLSATEIFLYQIDTRIVNSNGIDVGSRRYECHIETIPNFVNGEEEVELYQAISFGSFDPKDLTAKVAEALTLCKDRSKAEKLPVAGPLPVILEGEEIEEFFGGFVDDLRYETAFSKANVYEPGSKIQGEAPTGDALNITLKPVVEGALASSSVDDDGVILPEVKLIENGVAKCRHGSSQYGYYLGEKHPTGRIPVVEVAPGTKTMEDWKKAPYLRCVKFSGIQVDLHSGMLGGEVRLGYYFDGEKEIPVTGFSIQADARQAITCFQASKQTMVRDRYFGPKYIYIPDVKIA